MSDSVHQIHRDLIGLATPIGDLKALPGNPRQGNVEAIMASFQQFGQVKPFVVHTEEDGTRIVIAGNHGLQAAKRLGWTHVAVVEFDGDNADSISFSLMDNRTSELGGTDPELLSERLHEVVDVYPEMFETVGWDDFAIAAIDHSIQYSAGAPTGSTAGYVPPTLVSRPGEPIASGPAPVAVSDSSIDSGAKFVAPQGLDQKSAVVGGVATDAGLGRKVSVQYTLVFDDGEQISRWWDFVRWLRSNPDLEAETIAGRMMEWLESMVEF